MDIRQTTDSSGFIPVLILLQVFIAWNRLLCIAQVEWTVKHVFCCGRLYKQQQVLVTIYKQALDVHVSYYDECRPGYQESPQKQLRPRSTKTLQFSRFKIFWPWYHTLGFKFVFDIRKNSWFSTCLFQKSIGYGCQQTWHGPIVFLWVVVGCVYVRVESVCWSSASVSVKSFVSSSASKSGRSVANCS